MRFVGLGSSLTRKWTFCQNDRRARAKVGGHWHIGIYKNADVPPISEEKSQLNSTGNEGRNEYNCLSTVEELSEALEYADSLEMFQAITEHEPLEIVADAIALMPSIPLRSLLRGFYDAVYGQLEYLWGT